MAKDILLQKIEMNEIGIIDRSRPVLLYLADAYKEGKNIAIATGDQGTGKSTWLTCLLGLFCKEFDIKEEYLYNNKSGKINSSYEFEFKGNQYRVTWTKSAFKLQKKELNELTDKEGWRDETSPVSTIQAIIGYVGTSPMTLKTKDGAKQVEEIRKALSAPKEVQEEEKKLLEAFEIAKKSRTDANREYTRLQKALEANEMFVNWEESEKKYSEKKNIDNEREKLQELATKKDRYNLAQQQVTTHIQTIGNIQNDITDIQRQIDNLEARLETKTRELVLAEAAKEMGDRWIEENKSIVDEYNIAQEAYMNIQAYLAEQKQWGAVLIQKAEMDQYSDLVIKADATKDELKQKLLDIGKKGLPEIEGLEVVTSDAIDGKGRGVYVNGLNIYQLSESELWSLFLQIWESQGVKYVAIDNIQNLGSEAVSILNRLASQGVKIFATQMRRGKSFEVIITDKITD